MRDPVSATTNGRIRDTERSRQAWNPHQEWPNQSSGGLTFEELERHLQKSPRTQHRVQRLLYRNYASMEEQDTRVAAEVLMHYKHTLITNLRSPQERRI